MRVQGLAHGYFNRGGSNDGNNLPSGGRGPTSPHAPALGTPRQRGAGQKDMSRRHPSEGYLLLLQR
eukprot:2920988-Pyramimonas_sp.AAC.1